MFKSLKEIATHLHFIRCGIDDLAHALKDWDAACTEESEEAGGIVRAKNLKPGWVVDGKKIIAVTRDGHYDRVYLRFSDSDNGASFNLNSLILVDKEEQQ
jgi:hypothetical protein